MCVSHSVVRQVDGKLVMKYKHPGAVFGCDWSPNNKYVRPLFIELELGIRFHLSDAYCGK